MIGEWRASPSGWNLEDNATLGDDGVWRTAGAEADVDYPDDSHELLAAVEDHSEWFRERNRLIAAALERDGLPTHMVEVGSGNGFVATHLRGLGVDVLAVEPGRGGAAVSSGRGVPTVCGLFEELELPSESLASVGVFDVLEHLERPRELLAEVKRVLAPGGRLAVTVPAMPALWSRADVLAGHHRRYTRATLAKEVVGFTPVTIDYAFLSMVPAIGLLRTLPHRVGVGAGDDGGSAAATRQVAGYGSLGRRLSRVAFRVDDHVRRRRALPFGSSLIAVFAKN